MRKLRDQLGAKGADVNETTLWLVIAPKNSQVEISNVFYRLRSERPLPNGCLVVLIAQGAAPPQPNVFELKLDEVPPIARAARLYDGTVIDVEPDGYFRGPSGLPNSSVVTFDKPITLIVNVKAAAQKCCDWDLVATLSIDGKRRREVRLNPKRAPLRTTAEAGEYGMHLQWDFERSRLAEPPLSH
jgi:hypothetical protein